MSGSCVEAGGGEHLLAMGERHAPVERGAGAALVQIVLPEGMARGDGGNDREILRRRRGGDRPHSSVGPPPHGSGPAGAEPAGCAARSRRGQATPIASTKLPIVVTAIERGEAHAGRIGVDPARHAEEAGQVHRQEGEVEAVNIVQKFQRPRRSSISRPVIFGNQK